MIYVTATLINNKANAIFVIYVTATLINNKANNLCDSYINKQQSQ